MNESEFERELFKYRTVRQADHEGQNPVKPVVDPALFSKYAALLKAKDASQSGAASSGETITFVVRPLKGKEHVVQAVLSETVLDIKRKLEADVGLAPAAQSLVYKGKPLQDGLTLAECHLEPNARVNLVPRTKIGAASTAPSATAPTTTAPPAAAASDSATSQDFWSHLGAFLRQHFSEADADKVLRQFRGEHDARMGAMTMADIEALAKKWTERANRV